MTEHISIGRRQVLVAIGAILFFDISTYALSSVYLDFLPATIFLIPFSIIAFLMFTGESWAKPVFIFMASLKPFVLIVLSVFMFIQNVGSYNLSADRILLLLLACLSIFMVFALGRSKYIECFFAQQRIKHGKQGHVRPLKNGASSLIDKKSDISATENFIVIAFAVIMMVPVIIILFFVLLGAVFVLTGNDLGGLAPSRH